MTVKFHRPICILLGICWLFLFGGCSLWNEFFGPEEELTPGEIMAEGMADYNDGKFKEVSGNCVISYN